MTIKYRKIAKKAFTALLAIAGALLLTVAGFLVFAELTDYKPGSVEKIAFAKALARDTIPVGKLRLYTWNIGYCGLGAEMDFFYENGEMVMPDRKNYARYREGIGKQLSELKEPDFVLLQEVDRHSKRSFNDDQVSGFQQIFKGYSMAFACNYKVPFVPVPLKSPMGGVDAGLLIFGRYSPLEAQRIDYQSAYGWPKRLFMLDRCFVLARYPVSNGKQLVLINLHNSAFGDAAEMRAKELRLLRQVLVLEYSKGNYVIAGGDWNQNPIPFCKDSLLDGNLAKTIVPGIPGDFLPDGFQWAFDQSFPTNRDVDKPFAKGKTPTTIIDFFVLSPNINILKTNTLQTNFTFSDHQPVGMEVELR